MKPRKPLIKLPSLSEGDSEPPHEVQRAETDVFSPSATTDRSPRQRTQSTIAKIRGITNEIRHLSNLSKSFETKLKRPLSAVDLTVPDNKKQKID